MLALHKFPPILVNDSMPIGNKATVSNDEVPLDTEEQIRDVYGERFCNTVGIENILKMPRVTAESLNLQNPGKYPSQIVLVDFLKEASAVKGLDGCKRPFIAIRMEYYDNRENKIVKYVELIFKRYSIDGDGGKGQLHENTYVSALDNMCDDGRVRESVFYQTGGTQDWSHMKVLMDGQLVRTALMKDRGGFVRKI